jgi:hypothetical protein
LLKDCRSVELHFVNSTVFSPMTIHSPMGFAGIGRLNANATSRLAIAGLPLAIAVALAVVGAFGSYVSMRLPLRLLHFCATSIGALAFAVTTALLRYLFRGAEPLWAAILHCNGVGAARGADRAAIIAALRTASPAIRLYW